MGKMEAWQVPCLLVAVCVVGGATVDGALPSLPTLSELADDVPASLRSKIEQKVSDNNDANAALVAAIAKQMAAPVQQQSAVAGVKAAEAEALAKAQKVAQTEETKEQARLAAKA